MSLKISHFTRLQNAMTAWKNEVESKKQQAIDEANRLQAVAAAAAETKATTDTTAYKTTVQTLSGNITTLVQSINTTLGEISTLATESNASTTSTDANTKLSSLIAKNTSMTTYLNDLVTKKGLLEVAYDGAKKSAGTYSSLTTLLGTATTLYNTAITSFNSVANAKSTVENTITTATKKVQDLKTAEVQAAAAAELLAEKTRQDAALAAQIAAAAAEKTRQDNALAAQVAAAAAEKALKDAALAAHATTIASTTTAIGTKQDSLVSGTNIKTINGTSVLGSGNISIPAGPQGPTGPQGPAGATGATGASGSSAWSGVTGKPTTVSGYGITDMGSQSVAYASNSQKINPLSGDANYKLCYTADGQRTNAGEWGRAVMRYEPNGQTYGIRVDRADYANSAAVTAHLGHGGRRYEGGGVFSGEYREVFNPSATSVQVRPVTYYYNCNCDGGNGCVVETTGIKTINGVKQIKDIKENDLILVNNEEVKVSYSVNCPLNGRDLIIINDSIICTEDHAWLLNDNNFTVSSLEKYEEKRNIVLNDNGKEIGFVGLVDKSKLKQLEIGDVLKNGIIVTSIEKYGTDKNLHMLFTDNGLFETDSGFISEAHISKF